MSYLVTKSRYRFKLILRKLHKFQLIHFFLIEVHVMVFSSWQVLEMTNMQIDVAVFPIILCLLYFVFMFMPFTAASVRWSSPRCGTGARHRTEGWQVIAACGHCLCMPLQSISWRAWELGSWSSTAQCQSGWWSTPYLSTSGSSAGGWGWHFWTPVPGTTQVLGTTWGDWWHWSMPCPGPWQR